MKRTIRLTESDLERVVKRVINETPFDEIDFGFMDQEELEKEQLRTRVKEILYNKMAQDKEILREMYRMIVDSLSENQAKGKFKDSQIYNRVERYMELIYGGKLDGINIRGMFGDGELFSILEKTFDKFFSDVYTKVIERHNRVK